MKREEIEKAAIELCTSEKQEEWLKDYGIHCFLDGARWQINSVWHNMKEKPNFKKLSILLELKKEGKIRFIDEPRYNWDFMIEYYARWAYVEDLLPAKDE